MISYLFLNCVLLLLLLFSRSLEGKYTFKKGENAYLPCNYFPSTHQDVVPMCWGRGDCPLLDCQGLVLRTDGRNLSYRTSDRYQLRGYVYKGDVSLTIENVTLKDSGNYCCRIQFPGPWNDKKITLELVVKPAELTPIAPGPTQRRKNFTTSSPRTLPTTSMGLGSAETQTSETIHTENRTESTEFYVLPDSGSNTKTSIYIAAGVSAGLVLALILGIFIFKCYSHNKESENISLSTLANSLPSGIANAVAEGTRSENIYVIEENAYEMEDPYECYCSVSEGQLSWQPLSCHQSIPSDPNTSFPSLAFIVSLKSMAISELVLKVLWPLNSFSIFLKQLWNWTLIQADLTLNATYAVHSRDLTPSETVHWGYWLSHGFL